LENDTDMNNFDIIFGLGERRQNFVINTGKYTFLNKD
jgi:hypothetical protein